MKKIMAVAALAAALALTGCSDDAGLAKDGNAPAASEVAKDAPKEAPVEEKKADVPSDHKSALKSAETYSKTMHMSKVAVYDQLTSEYGGKFTPEAAQYAIDTMTADWNANALASAKVYQETMAMSPEAIRDQLTSEHGGKFTAEEAEYAVANLG